MISKKELRAVCRAKRSNIGEKEGKNRAIVARALELPEVKASDALFIFYPLKDEVDLLPLMDYAKKNGKKIAFPLCEDKEGSMRFCEIDSLDGLNEGCFGLREPSKDSPEILPRGAVIFLPALAIDKKGYRLGYGKGYYDRYLAKHAEHKPYTVGVIYKELIFDELPRDEYDLPCDTVVSEDGVINGVGRCRKQRSVCSARD